MSMFLKKIYTYLGCSCATAKPPVSRCRFDARPSPARKTNLCPPILSGTLSDGCFHKLSMLRHGQS